MSIDAFIWNDQRNQNMAVKLAWDIAMLSRQKRIPALKALLQRRSPKALQGDELIRRRDEFKSMTGNLNLQAINDTVSRIKNRRR